MSTHIFGTTARLLSSLLLCLACSISMFATDSIVSDGKTFFISGDTILLDREGLFGCDNAFTDPAEAFGEINSIGSRAVLLVAPSVYWLDDPDDTAIRSDKDGIPFAVRLKCDSLTIIGLSENPEDVVFAANRGQTQGAIGNFTMFEFSGNNLEIKNITFGNYCNIDLIYPRNHDYDRPKRKDAIVQAQIGICRSTDRLYAQNCRFISRLNLCPFVGARRSLYDDCYFECTDDALSGSAVYLDCRFTFFSSKPFYSTAETGAVFLNCDINCLGSGVQYFTKVPGQVTAIDTRFSCPNPIDIRWTRDASDIVCHQENISLNGSPYTIDADRPELGPSLSGSTFRNAYKVDYNGKSLYNLPNLLNGTDGWDPKRMNSIISDIEAETDAVLTGLPVSLRMDIRTPEPLNDGDQVIVMSTPLLWGGYPVAPLDSFTFIAQNSNPVKKQVVIPVSTPEGLTSRTTLTIEPKLRQAPKFKKKPSIRYDESDGLLHVDYSLSGKGEDDSRIMWCRVIEEDSGRRVLLMKESDATKGQTFKAKAGDLGNGIMAVVFPKFKDSKYGPLEASEVISLTELAHVEEYPESLLSTDFSDIGIVERDPGIPGIWSFDVFKPADTSHVDWQPADGPGWYYGKGFDASTGTGIVQNEKGARMIYVPARDVCSDMKVSLVAEPAKGEGQGFGSATSQYMDICVKFDPINLDGYALRIERTPDYDNAVSFSIVRYDKGVTSVISENVISDCFRNPCYIEVGIEDGVMRASAYTEASRQGRSRSPKVMEKVELSTPVASTYDTGFCIQHTGSTGPSSTLLRDLRIEWR
ncbi:MAG: hypothetical protein K2N25_00350 [Muribaculaceae bacterium]|nr:hypothetical protein [Muribaculaceae bacterium]